MKSKKTNLNKLSQNPYNKTGSFTIFSLPSSLPPKENSSVSQSRREIIPDNSMSMDLPVINNSSNSVDSRALQVSAFSLFPSFLQPSVAMQPVGVNMSINK